MGLLAERGRIAYLPDIVTAYGALVDEELGQARARVRARVPLTEQEKERIAARLQQAVGKRIILEEQQDTTLLGGFVAQVGSLILDASLNHQLERLRARLAGG
jgi:F-type H+-transporting ATPase subunit delta